MKNGLVLHATARQVATGSGCAPLVASGLWFALHWNNSYHLAAVATAQCSLSGSNRFRTIVPSHGELYLLPGPVKINAFACKVVQVTSYYKIES